MSLEGQSSAPYILYSAVLQKEEDSEKMGNRREERGGSTLNGNENEVTARLTWEEGENAGIKRWKQVRKERGR